jgi:hypothetical protein
MIRIAFSPFTNCPTHYLPLGHKALAEHVFLTPATKLALPPAMLFAAGEPAGLQAMLSGTADFSDIPSP